MYACSVASVVSDSVIPWTVACQVPLTMGFSRQEYQSGLPHPPSRGSSWLQMDSLPTETQGNPWSTRNCENDRFYAKCMLVLTVQLVALMLRDMPFMHPGLSALHFPFIHSRSPSFNSYAPSDSVTGMVFRFTEMIQTVHSRVERPQWRPTRTFKRVQGEVKWGSSNYVIRVRKYFKDTVIVEPNPKDEVVFPRTSQGEESIGQEGWKF